MAILVYLALHTGFVCPNGSLPMRREVPPIPLRFLGMNIVPSTGLSVCGVQLETYDDRAFAWVCAAGGADDGPFFAWHDGRRRWAQGQCRAGVPTGSWHEWQFDGRERAGGEDGPYPGEWLRYELFGDMLLQTIYWHGQRAGSEWIRTSL
jgi:hypothetical protein